MSETVKELTCIVCPMGCTLRVTMDGDRFVSVTGNTCPRGAKYAETEMTAPRRVLTSTVWVSGGHLPLCPVRTKGDIPKEMLFDAMRVLDSLCVQAPVSIGQVLVEDLCGTGVPLIATRDIHSV